MRKQVDLMVTRWPTATKDRHFLDPHQESGEVNYYLKLSEKDKEIQFQKLLENTSSLFIGPNGTMSPGLNQLRWPKNVVLLIKIVQNHVQGFSQLSTKHMDLARRGVDN